MPSGVLPRTMDAEEVIPRRALIPITMAPIILLLGLIPLLTLFPSLGASQVLGEVAELDRLEQKAEEAMGQGDSHGAALSIGKAALMASILAEQEQEKPSGELWNAAGQLFRGQEDVYRALALFEQTGGTPPPPAGVCQALHHSLTKIQLVHKNLENIHGQQDSDVAHRIKRYLDSTQEWEILIPELIQDVSC